MHSLHLKELPWILQLQKEGSPFWNQLANFFNFFDTEYFYLLLILVIWIVFDWKTGSRILFLLLLSAFLNNSLKVLFQMPRPFDLDANAAVLFTISGFGFPSGGAQNAMLFALVFAHHLKRWWGCWLAFLYVFLVSFSRVYLGLHFFSDILAGFAVGYLLFWAYRYVFPKVEKFLQKHSLWENLLLAQIAAFLMRFFNDSKDGSRIALSVSLLSLFLFLALKLNLLAKKQKKNKKFKHKRIAVSLAGIFVIALGCLFSACRFLTAGVFFALWLIFGVGFILRRTDKRT